MRSVRQRLRVLAATWVVFQALSLSVLVAPWCCLVTHASEMSASAPPCPMHGVQASAHHHSADPEHTTAHSDCAMRAACGGQAAALFAALSNIGVLQDVIAVADSSSAAPLSFTHTQPVSQFPTPDAPPPRPNLATL